MAYISCIIYSGSGGDDAYGNPAKIEKYTYRFSTYKDSTMRHIRMLSSVDKNGQNITTQVMTMVF